MGLQGNYVIAVIILVLFVVLGLIALLIYTVLRGAQGLAEKGSQNSIGSVSSPSDIEEEV